MIDDYLHPVLEKINADGDTTYNYVPCRKTKHALGISAFYFSSCCHLPVSGIMEGRDCCEGYTTAARTQGNTLKDRVVMKGDTAHKQRVSNKNVKKQTIEGELEGATEEHASHIKNMGWVDLGNSG